MLFQSLNALQKTRNRSRHNQDPTQQKNAVLELAPESLVTAGFSVAWCQFQRLALTVLGWDVLNKHIRCVCFERFTRS